VLKTRHFPFSKENTPVAYTPIHMPFDVGAKAVIILSGGRGLFLDVKISH
jgi:hypothetical protein